jgi:hypothetical protein
MFNVPLSTGKIQKGLEPALLAHGFDKLLQVIYSNKPVAVRVSRVVNRK